MGRIMSDRQDRSETGGKDPVSVAESSASGTNVPVLKVTTTSGATYMIDRANGRASRVNNDTAPEMRYDDKWFEFNQIRAHDPFTGQVVEEWIGARLYFAVKNHPSWAWRLTTTVVSVEEQS